MAPASKAEKKAAVDAAAWMFNVVSSVGIIIVNKALMATYGFSFGKFYFMFFQISLVFCFPCCTVNKALIVYFLYCLFVCFYCQCLPYFFRFSVTLFFVSSFFLVFSDLYSISFLGIFLTVKFQNYSLYFSLFTHASMFLVQVVHLIYRLNLTFHYLPIGKRMYIF